MNKDLKNSLKAVAGDVLKLAYNANEDKIKKHLSDAQFRKVRKLANNPELFVKDVVTKKKEQARKYLPIKYDGNFSYTVVSAVYNVEKYLDEYFESLVNQSLDFKKHIHLILVDDGSTDNSAQIIKKWQKKYPKNIHYYYKENGGQGSARKLGLQYVETDWVTFVDADDFVSVDYFYNIDEIVSSDSTISMVCCNQIYYFEDENQYIDRHPLNYRFKDGVKSVKFKDIGKNIHFSAALSFLKVAKIPYGLSFDEYLKPTFEDGKFINSFILEQNAEDKICYNPNSKYFNRKRADKSSTMDGIWEHKGQFTTVFERGYLDILPKCKQEKGHIPVFLQRTILWEMLKLVKQLLNKSEMTNFLSEEERNNFLMNMDEVFTYIDKDVIMSYELGNCGFSRQLGMLGCFKKLDVDRQVAYLDKVDFDKNLFEIRFFSSFENDFMLLVDNEEIFPTYYKKTNRYFLDRVFLTEYRLWYSLDLLKGKRTADFSVNQRRAYVNFNKQKYKKGIVIADILNYPKTTTNNNIWLLMDRDDRAGDNAEFLYDYIQENQQHIQPHFVLGRNSIDWDRLRNKGYNLVEHGSLEHKKLLEKCSIVASSQIGYLVEPFDDINKKYKVVFLQHGITKDDVSNWLNNLNIDLLVTASMSEYLSIVDDYSKYIYGKKDVVLSGFPRFDSLYKNTNNYDKKISLIFTWRKYIAGNFVENGKSERQINPDFKNTTYYQKLNELLNSNDLKQLIDKYGYQVEICPHPNMVPYIQFFDIPPYIMVVDSEKRMHDLINESQILITDFSSVAFDFAYQNKNVLYYQFDQKEFFSGEHTYQKGYFDYEQHGFGAVVETEMDLLTALEQVLQNNGEPVEPYATRIRETFPFRDGNNCERVYQSIQSLYEPAENAMNLDILQEMVNLAHQEQNWRLLMERAARLLEFEPKNKKVQALLVKALIQTKQWAKAKEVIDFCGSDNMEESALLVAFIYHDWQLVVLNYRKVQQPTFELSYKYLHALIKLGKTNQATKFIENLLQNELLEAQKTTLTLILLSLHDQYQQAIMLMDEVVSMDNDELLALKPQLLLARAYRKLGEYTLAHQQLESFEKHTKEDVECRLEIAKLAFAQGQYSKCVNQFEKLINLDYPLTEAEQKQYLDSVFLVGQYDKYKSLYKNYEYNEEGGEIIEQEKKVTTSNQAFRVAYINEDWQGVLEAYPANADNGFDDVMLCAYALKKLDKMQEAQTLICAIDDSHLTEQEQVLKNVFLFDLGQEYQNVVVLAEPITQLALCHKKLFKPELLLAKSYRKLGEYTLAHQQLESFEKHTKEDVECRLEIAKLAFAQGQYSKCVNQFEKLINLDYPLTEAEQKQYLDSVFLVGQYDKYKSLYKNYEYNEEGGEIIEQEKKVTTSNQAFRVAYINEDWQGVLEAYPANADNGFDDVMLCACALKKLGKMQEAQTLICAIDDSHLTEQEQVLKNVFLFDLGQEYQNVVVLAEPIIQLALCHKKLFKPELLLAKSYRKLGEYTLAHQQLESFEKHTKEDVECRLEIAKLAFAQGQYSKCVNQFEKLINLDYPLTEAEQKQYLDSVFLVGQYDKFMSMVSKYFNSDLYQREKIKSMVYQKQWEGANEVFNSNRELKEELIYEYAVTQYRLGRFENLDKILPKPIFGHPYEYWELMGEIAMLNGNIELQKYCYKGMIAIFPDNNVELNHKKLHLLSCDINYEELK